MSRSRRKHPFMGITCSESEKQDKQLASRKLRRVQKQKMEEVEIGNDLILPKESSGYWFAKDGWYRFDASKNPEWLRK